MSVLILAFVVYLFVLIVIGIWSSRFNKTLDDFLIADRKLGSWPVAISAEASDMSGWLVLGLPGRAFMYGVSALWVALATSFGTLFNWSVIARRFRRFTEKLHALTIPDYLEARFDDETHVIRGLSTVVITVFMVAYVSVQLVASGKILSETFGWSYHSALFLSFVIITFYTLMGGFFAVAWTDVFQGLLIVGVILVLPIVGIIRVGGIGNVFSEIGRLDVNLLSPGYGYSGLLLLVFLFASLSWFFGYPGQPHILTRYMAIRDEKKIWSSTLIGMVWVVISLWGAVFIGILGLVFFKDLVDPEKVMPLMAMNLLPEWAAGVVIAAITAAIMSTADSQLLVAASSVVEDVYHKLVNPGVDQRRLVLYSRVSVLLLSVVALLLALQGGVVYYLVAFAWGGLAASFGPLIILSLWWRGVNRYGAIGGMLSGMFTVIVWDKMGVGSVLSGDVVVPGMLPGFFVSLFCIVFVSLLTGLSDKKIE